jgi:hypothetical protein
VPTRDADSGFAATVTVTKPVPRPCDVDSERNGVIVVAVHAQSAAVAVTEIDTGPPPAPMLSRVGWMMSVQGEAACDTGTDWPATDTLAVRSLGDVF